MKRVFIFSFIVLGITSIIAQLVIIRELMISFYGNEFFIGWVIFSWLFWTGIGSLFLKKLFKKENLLKTFATTYVLVALFLPLEIYLIRFGKNIIGGTPGEIPNLVPALLYAFLIIAPLCLILGFQFVIINKFRVSFLNMGGSTSHILGKSYFYETIGFITGGIIFSYILIFVNEFRVASILAWLNLIIAGFILFLLKNRFVILKIITIGLLIIFIGIFISADEINFQTTKLRFPSQELIESKNSLYGNITVTKTDNQYNFYESGLFLGADKEEILNEYLVHFPLLYHPNPKNMLLIGTGFNGALGEILKHQPNKIYYLELDPELIKTAKKYILPQLQKDLEDKKVTIINTDARYFLKTTSEVFDVIIINLPNPSTALINRFYGQEFFNEAKLHLKLGGVIAIHLSSSPNYLTKELENLQASVYQTIKMAFPYLIILPEDTNFFIASQENILNYNPGPLIQRLKERNIKNNFVTENYIEYRLTNDRVQNFLNSLKTNSEAKINKDTRPISYYYNFIYWVSYFHSGSAKFLAFLLKIKFIWIIGLLALLTALAIGSRVLSSRFPHEPQRDSLRDSALVRPASQDTVPTRARNPLKDNTRNPYPLAMAIAGFSLMTVEIIIIYAFQVFYGYLYYKIGLIITALMIGMAIGTWLGTKWIKRAQIKTLIKIHALIILFSTILFSIFYFLFKISPPPSFIIELFFLICAALIGIAVGFEFPIVNKLYLSQTKNASQKVGIIYGADLLGSCLGASLISILILPIFGVSQTLLILAALNVLIIVSLFGTRSTG